MNIAIVEDTARDCEWLTGRLEQYLTSRHLTYQLYTYKQAEDFVAALDTISFQIVFMDIYLTDMTGIEAATILRQRDKACKLIILTSSDEYLLQGYQVHASHYLIKPATDRDFEEAMERCMLKPAYEVPVIDIVQDGLSLPLNTETILYLQAHKRDVLIQTTTQPLLTAGPFHALVDVLSGDSRFLMVLRGIMINMDYVVSIDDTLISMKNGDALPYNVRNRKQIQQTYRNYIFNKMGGTS